jgi:sec-independent protein translocase protein TatA
MPDGLFANPLHWVILIVVVLIVFGPGKLPGVGASLGKSLREFKRASTEEDPAHVTPGPALSAAAPVHSVGAIIDVTSVCKQCGHANDPQALFCGECGLSLTSPVQIEEAPPEPAVAATPSICNSCQTQNPAGNHFCAHCGRLLEQVLHRV